ncbi:MAG: protocatechuate 4,5-dioxygenase subunit alpha, partial [Ilumatobacter sp.]
MAGAYCGFELLAGLSLWWAHGGSASPIVASDITPDNEQGAFMAIDKPYLDVPGTTVFDADQSRLGYPLNQFCMSLMKAENRERFHADEAAYLDEWSMSPEQKQSVLDRDMNRMISLGGNIYFLAKIGATDGKSFQQMAAS